MARLIDVNRECDRLDDMYTLGEIGRRERDDMAVFMLEIAMPVDAIPIEFIKARMEGYYKNSYTEFGACLETLIEDWRKEHETD